MTTAAVPSAQVPTEKVTEGPVPDKTYTEGDVTIISSDNVAFKLPSLILSTASPVFRNMLGFQQPAAASELALTDEDLETAAVLRDVFGIVTNRHLPSLVNSSGEIRTDQMAADLAFCDKYDLVMARAVLRVQLESWAGQQGPKKSDQHIYVDDVFSVAARAGFDDICEKALRFGSTQSWGSDPAHLANKLNNLPQQYLLMPSAMEWSEFRKLPHRHLWALSRTFATINIDKQQPSGQAADEFAELIELIKAAERSSSPKTG